jgi:uncharacterized Zn finger protein
MTSALRSRTVSRKVPDPGSSYLGSLFLQGFDTGPSRWSAGLGVFKAGKVRKWKAESAFVEAAVLGTYDSRVHTAVPEFEVQVTFDPLHVPDRAVSNVRALSRMLDTRLGGGPLRSLLQSLRLQGVELIPQDVASILRATCSCLDFHGERMFQARKRRRSEPCKHVASVLYKLASLIDHDPSILLRIRGMQNMLQIGSVRQADTAADVAAAVPSRSGCSKNDPICLDKVCSASAADAAAVPCHPWQLGGSKFVPICLV